MREPPRALCISAKVAVTCDADPARREGATSACASHAGLGNSCCAGQLGLAQGEGLGGQVSSKWVGDLGSVSRLCTEQASTGLVRGRS